MQIETMELDNQGPDRDRTDVFAKIKDELGVIVEGFGSGEGRWKVVSQRANPMLDGQGSINRVMGDLFGEADAEGFRSMEVLGNLAVYMEPATFAHAMWDLVRNG